MEALRGASEKFRQRSPNVAKSLQYSRGLGSSQTKTRTPSGIASESFRKALMDEGIGATTAESYMREVASMEQSRFMNMKTLASSYNIMITLGIEGYDSFINTLSSQSGVASFQEQLTSRSQKILQSSDIQFKEDERYIALIQLQAEMVNYIKYVSKYRDTRYSQTYRV